MERAFSFVSAFALTRTVIFPFTANGAMVGLCCVRIKSSKVCSNTDSPMPVKFNTFDSITISPLIDFKYGMTSSENICFISLGTPGINIHITSLYTTKFPVAIPTLFDNTFESSKTLACLRLFPFLGHDKSRLSFVKSLFLPLYVSLLTVETLHVKDHLVLVLIHQ